MKKSRSSASLASTCMTLAVVASMAAIVGTGLLLAAALTKGAQLLLGSNKGVGHERA